MIVKMEPAHLMLVMLNARKEEFERWQIGPDPQRWVCSTALKAGIAFTVLNEQGHPVACFGFLDEVGTSATIWMLCTNEWKRWIKQMRKTVDAVINGGVYTRVQAMIDPLNAPAVKFIRWLGFEKDGTVRKGAPDGSDFDLYSIVRAECQT